MSKIRDVVMGDCRSHTMALATSGLDTCIGLLVLLRQEDFVMAHIDRTKIHRSGVSVDVAAQKFIEYCIKRVHRLKPGVAIDSVFLIGGHNTISYQRLSQWIDGARVSLSAVAQSQRVTTEQLRDFLQKIKINLSTCNIPRIRATSDNVDEVDDDGNRSDSARDYLSDCTVVYDQSFIPPILIVAQRAGEEHEMTGDTTLTSPIAIYKVDVASGGVSGTTYPPLYESPHSPLLVESVRHNVTDRSLIIHRPFDLPNDDEHRVLLSKVDEHLTD